MNKTKTKILIAVGLQYVEALARHGPHSEKFERAKLRLYKFIERHPGYEVTKLEGTRFYE